MPKQVEAIEYHQNFNRKKEENKANEICNFRFQEIFKGCALEENRSFYNPVQTHQESIQNRCYLEAKIPPTKDTNGFTKTFPQRLMDMLNFSGSKNIISWSQKGDSFIIINEQYLSNTLLPLFFKKTKYMSFIRKINRWGFRRYLNGKKLCVFYHKLFVREDPRLCLHMGCQGLKQNNQIEQKLREKDNKRNDGNKEGKFLEEISSSVFSHDERKYFPTTKFTKESGKPCQQFLHFSNITGGNHTNTSNSIRVSFTQSQNFTNFQRASIDIKTRAYDAATHQILSNSVLAKKWKMGVPCNQERRLTSIQYSQVKHPLPFSSKKFQALPDIIQSSSSVYMNQCTVSKIKKITAKQA